jgi:hypothetical protein
MVQKPKKSLKNRRIEGKGERLNLSTMLKTSKYLLLILIFGIMLAGCKMAEPKPFKMDDHYIYIDLKREFVREKAKQVDVTKGYYIKEKPDNLGEAVLYGYVNVLADGVQLAISGRSKVTVWPSYRIDYKQKIFWGKNKVYIPKELKGKEFYLRVNIDGSYSGFFYVSITQTKKKIKLRKDTKAFKMGKDAYLRETSADVKKPSQKEKDADKPHHILVKRDAYELNYPYADVKKPLVFKRETFELKYPSNWEVDKQHVDFDPDKFFIIKGSGAAIRFKISDNESNVQENIAEFKKEYEGKIRIAKETEFTKWGQYEGKGLEVQGKLLDLIESTVKFFGFNHQGRSYFITIHYSDDNYPRAKAGIELVEKSFKLLPKQKKTRKKGNKGIR